MKTLKVLLASIIIVLTSCSSIHYSAQRGDTNRIGRYLQEGKGVNARDVLGRTPLMEAALHGQIKTVRYLLEKGADVNLKDNRGNTALILAARSFELSNSLEKSLHPQAIHIASLLLRKGADINSVDKNGLSPLLAALGGGPDSVVNPKLAMMLLQKGAAVGGAVKDKGHTALILASGNGFFDIVKLLLAKNVPVDVKDLEGSTALHWAVLKDRVRIVVQLIIAGADVNAKDKKGYTALMIARANKVGMAYFGDEYEKVKTVLVRAGGR